MKRFALILLLFSFFNFQLPLVCFQLSTSACHALTKKEMALQLYSIREVIGSPDKYAQNHAEVFQKLAAWGYTAVEAASYDQGRGTFYGVSPQQFRTDCETAGMISDDCITDSLRTFAFSNHASQSQIKKSGGIRVHSSGSGRTA